MIAFVVAPNRMIANGNHAIDGIVCMAVISEPVAARSGLIRDTSAPITAPMSTDSANPITARRMVMSMACHSWACCICSHRLAKTAPGPGSTYCFHPVRWTISQAPMTRPIASSFGQVAAQMLRALHGCLRTWTVSRLSSPASAGIPGSSAPARPAAPAPPGGLPSLAMAAHLLTQPVGDLAGQLGDLRRIDSARAGNGHRELVDDPAGPAGQHHDPVAEPDRLPHVVRDEQYGQPPVHADPVELVVQQVPGHSVQGAERLVHEEHVGVGGQRPGHRHPLPHAAGQLVWPLVAEAA